MDGVGDDTMGGAPMPPMGDEMGSEPNGEIGGEDENMPPMEDDNEPIGNDETDSADGNSEIDGIMDGLSTEDQAAVVKYAKSLSDDNDEPQNDMGSADNGMPMESRLYHRVIREALDDMLDAKNSTPRGEKKMSVKAKRSPKNPFMSPFN